MPSLPRLPALWLGLLGLTTTQPSELFGQSKPAAPAQAAAPAPLVVHPGLPGAAAAIATINGDRMPLTKLSPSKIFPNLCIYEYRVTTQSELCQKYVDQGLGFYYSYVWMEAARSFETALKHDPECAMAWWGLSRSLEKWGKGDANAALKQAMDRMKRASDRERLLIRSRAEEKGLAPNTKPDERVKKASATLDDLLTLYADDQEAWFNRAQLAKGTAAIPYYKALLMINPVHPGATHELVHFYENYRRPGLGWPYAEAYMKSSPGIPHPFHMQAHLATRLGKWKETSNQSTKAIDLERAYHKFQGVKPADDHQFSHHLEILTLSLIHDGRFAEARKIKEEAKAAGYQHPLPWFALHRREQDWAEAMKIVESQRRRDKSLGAYLAATLYLDQNKLAEAKLEIDVIREASQKRKNDRRMELRLWETLGRYLCRTGSPDEGLKLIFRTIEKTKDDFGHHSWGNGAYYMETWGDEALLAGKAEIAEEAYLEALAHDAGSVRAAMGLQYLCQRLNRTDEAANYARLANDAWARADQPHVERLRQEMLASSASLLPNATVSKPTTFSAPMNP
ncbi:tetratricopeptide repeat protein [Tuwongella immobilis]|uniref:Tetratricopeptide repeat protein: Tetratricopeptide repeat domain protein n=1 Tax=Tuwongella immobilis TaxID=692036 RepID=A0A6C2YQQ7_9BACT|nr:hypothetical protein [Tuwongella immobilis]VIP03816.1 tetratricopeptide repeat protein : Tetratricopeptide repeat domain protein OS=uncultured planctomycete GN=HGMM_F16E03C28 PE=4 SV=1 [Tuwongella immobilis]VTS04999.1 tetratricopeptide repeat protein : Tetratricopeptide repeat domain protein OS=uncultured planctomycete GN=HGMM_F16E03C28 PE=4 SV=1 [Tuwongella immobilis]